MSAARDQLVSMLEALGRSLEAGDGEAAEAQLAAFAVKVREAPGAAADPRVVALFQECRGKAIAVLGQLHQELSGHATSVRAAAAYGGGR
ncbi:MAG: hypothetical protein SFW67_11795 [Myxococcaceae bacterium]|nr:hypothetical protein [Myxococcaceae bacterium]